MARRPGWRRPFAMHARWSTTPASSWPTMSTPRQSPVSTMIWQGITSARTTSSGRRCTSISGCCFPRRAGRGQEPGRVLVQLPDPSGELRGIGPAGRDVRPGGQLDGAPGCVEAQVVDLAEPGLTDDVGTQRLIRPDQADLDLSAVPAGAASPAPAAAATGSALAARGLVRHRRRGAPAPARDPDRRERAVPAALPIPAVLSGVAGRAVPADTGRPATSICPAL